MILTAVDVSLRFLDAPIHGTQEITELAMAALIMLAIPYCTLTKGHVHVDVLDGLLGRTGRWLSDLLIASISMVVLGFLIWNTSLKVADTYRYADVTNLLAIPLWPVYVLLVASMAGYVIVVIRDFVNLLSTGKSIADREQAR